MDIKKEDPRERLIFALDTFSEKEAEGYVDGLEGVVNFFKVGIILHTLTGAGFISSMIKRDKKVFLDLKFFDIADTVRDAVKQVAGLGVSFLTVHANKEAMEAAVQGKKGSGLKILAVTLLTNLDSGEAESSMSSREIVLSRAKLALECGCDGVITSGREASAVKAENGGKLLVVTPGIRPSGSSLDGHKRSVSPGEAIRSGADYLVVGRPISKASDPRSAAESILNEMRTAFESV